MIIACLSRMGKVNYDTLLDCPRSHTVSAEKLRNPVCFCWELQKNRINWKRKKTKSAEPKV